MKDFFANILSDIGLNDLVDILVVAFLVYKIMGFIQQSRAEQLVKGLIAILIVTGLADILNLYTLSWILKSSLALGVVALVIVFQPELRRGLETIGRSNLLKRNFAQVVSDKQEEFASTIALSLTSLAKTKTGALVVIEKNTALSDICQTGVYIDAVITPELLGNIFYEKSPLHDGAIIIRNERIHSAGCVLPLTSNMDLPKELGTRHRAGIGITEYSDAITFIVSEETGIISCAKNGFLTRNVTGKDIEQVIVDTFDNNKSKGFLGGLTSNFKKNGGAANVDK
ncbi:MAG: diadenylate cyclase CdaA [Eubacteriales bacterium]|nr:diadenylate cyclase CdaA [Eubacteriales bacterium]MDY3332464.1 diadenylate cyclase CdaA [Gallibacter sp.]